MSEGNSRCGPFSWEFALERGQCFYESAMTLHYEKMVSCQILPFLLVPNPKNKSAKAFCGRARAVSGCAFITDAHLPIDLSSLPLSPTYPEKEWTSLFSWMSQHLKFNMSKMELVILQSRSPSSPPATKTPRAEFRHPPCHLPSLGSGHCHLSLSNSCPSYAPKVRVLCYSSVIFLKHRLGQVTGLLKTLKWFPTSR